jgi:hypothetical protein
MHLASSACLNTVPPRSMSPSLTFYIYKTYLLKIFEGGLREKFVPNELFFDNLLSPRKNERHPTHCGSKRCYIVNYCSLSFSLSF